MGFRLRRIGMSEWYAERGFRYELPDESGRGSLQQWVGAVGGSTCRGMRDDAYPALRLRLMDAMRDGCVTGKIMQRTLAGYAQKDKHL